MKRNLWIVFAAVVLVAIIAIKMVGGKSPELELLSDPGWPRVFEKGDNQVTVYQPQVDSWEGFSKLFFRSAIAVTTGSGQEATYGVAEVSADTFVDHETRLVVTHNHQRKIRFPDQSELDAASLVKVVDEVLPVKNSMTVSLDRVLAYLEPDIQGAQQSLEVNLQPPTIFYSREPAILVMFMGEPQFQPVNATDPTFLFAINTNWDVFYDTVDGLYYLLNGDHWLTSVDPLNGSWKASKNLCAGLLNLPENDNWVDVNAHIPGAQATQVPLVFVTTQPAEMIVTQGEPAFSPIRGTQLLEVSNTDSTLFLQSGEGQFYLLVAGRWFRAETLDGPWASASSDLPEDFGNIPDDSPLAFVKTAVPGTREAQDAVLLASVPKTTTVDFEDPPELAVVFEGEPEFIEIQETGVKYAVNTPDQVFLVGGAYYCCTQGVWFFASAPNGPWGLATNVPGAIYTIPPSNPNYNVTYVTVQQATPTTVVYGHTSGYSGEYVAANGVLMFGMGMLLGAAIADDHIHHYHWYRPPSFYSYGCHAVYHHGYGGYHAAAHVAYGPYGGAGRAAAYNAHTGTYSRGAYRYGPAGSAGARRAYNPYTGGHASQARVNTAFGSAGRSHVSQGGKSAWGGHRSGPNGFVGGIKTSEGSGAAAWNTRHSQGRVAKTKSGDVYAGHDGKVYKRDDNGQWKQHNKGNWNHVTPPSHAGPRDTKVQPKRSQTTVAPKATPRATTQKTSPRAATAQPKRPQTTVAQKATPRATTQKTSPRAATAQPTKPQAATTRKATPQATTWKGHSQSTASSNAGRQTSATQRTNTRAKTSRNSGGSTVDQSLRRDAHARSRGERNATQRSRSSQRPRSNRGGRRR